MQEQAEKQTPFILNIEEGQENFTKEHDTEGNIVGVGHFYLRLSVTAAAKTVYVPLSVSSGKKPAGFVYQIEGTGESSITTANVKLRDVKKSGVAEILLGTISYVEIPMGQTAIVELSFYIKGMVGREYAIQINRIEYKDSPSDARYQKYTGNIRTGTLQFH